MSVVTIFHHNNPRDARVFGYEQAGPATVTRVFEYSTEHTDPIAAAEEAFRLFNVGDDPDFGTPDPRAIAYRRPRNRSLSVGDVVMLRTGDSEVFLACESIGWVVISEPDVEDMTVHGTTPLGGTPFDDGSRK